MTGTKKPEAKAGRFTDVARTLLPLIAECEPRAERRWREAFGLERRPRGKDGGFLILDPKHRS